MRPWPLPLGRTRRVAVRRLPTLPVLPVLLALLAAAFTVPSVRAELLIPNVPLAARVPARPLVLLVAGKDHRLSYEAYNDASDLDGDGVLDLRFRPSVRYLGLFDPDLCYVHNGQADDRGLFTPAGPAAGALRTCAGQWSGNWLNYVTTSRIDALRVVLYGGLREVDTPDTTILRRAYIPQDSHSWAKEYTSAAVDGYRLFDYTPLPAPAAGRRHFFGNVTANFRSPCAQLDACSQLPPWLSVVTDSPKRVWEWASTERPVLADTTHGGTRSNYTVRVQACTARYHAGCRAYGSGFKPVGLLHDYGELDLMAFGLLTGSYDRPTSGGRLRKPVGSFRDEVHPATGQFTAAAAIVRSFDRLRIRDFNNFSGANARWGSYRGGWLGTQPATADQFPDWGNPVGEMMYESLRYFAGLKAPTPAYADGTRLDDEVGLPRPAWNDPFAAGGSSSAPTCARAHLLVLSDILASHDADEVPGAWPAFAAPGGPSGAALPGFDATRLLDEISSREPAVAGLHFIGQSGDLFDAAPTAKRVTSLASIRGLAPEEPTKQGGYTAAAAAAFGKRQDLRPERPGRQNVETFAIALATPLPRITVPLPGGHTITLVPFAKSVGGDFGISARKGAFQPTNQIVDFYVERVANASPAQVDPTVNGGRYYAKFRINFEDMEQGADHDMDAITEYTVAVTAEGLLAVTLRPIYQGGGVRQRMGYVISGTDQDGVYLEVQDEDEYRRATFAGPPLRGADGLPLEDFTPYFLNTPPGRGPGACDTTPLPADCRRLPWLGADAPDGQPTTRVFRAGRAAAATVLPDPLWYAAKWGGFNDHNGNDLPDLPQEWDADGDGVPDNYLLVQNPLRLLQALRRTLDEIVARSGSASNVSAGSGRTGDQAMVYQATFNAQRWSGDLVAYPVGPGGVSRVPAWRASTALPPWSQRRLFMRTAQGSTVAWQRFADLPLADRQALGSEAVFDWLRGDRSREAARGGILRDRDSPLGDMAHGSPFLDRATGTVYVGANDGMLHAFDAGTGRELFAFIPREAVARLADMATPAWSHRYLVDGPVLVTAVDEEQGPRLLFGQLGRGGKGLFALDVSRPAAFDGTGVLWEYTPQGHPAAATDPDLGLMLGRPVATRLADGRLAVLTGNGYNSRQGDAALYVFILDARGQLAQVRVLPVGRPGDNGLAAPAAVDADGDGRIDYAIAGDLQGQVWRFDLRSADPAGWRVDLQGQPLFRALGPDGRPQPITAPMTVARNDRMDDPNHGQLFAFFGTGSYFKADDPGSPQVQSWYGVLAQAPQPLAGRSVLRRRTFAAVDRHAGRSARSIERAVPGDMLGRAGWYLDFDVPAGGERIVTSSRLMRLAVPALVATSLVPQAGDACAAGGHGFLNVVDPFTGGATAVGLIDADRDQDFRNDRLADIPIGSIALGVGIPTEAVLAPGARTPSLQLVVGGSGAEADPATTLSGERLLGFAAQRRRIAWREILGE